MLGPGRWLLLWQLLYSPGLCEDPVNPPGCLPGLAENLCPQGAGRLPLGPLIQEAVPPRTCRFSFKPRSNVTSNYSRY